MATKHVVWHEHRNNIQASRRKRRETCVWHAAKRIGIIQIGPANESDFDGPMGWRRRWLSRGALRCSVAKVHGVTRMKNVAQELCQHLINGTRG